MDHIVDHIFVFEGNGRIKDYHSNYTEYLATRKAAQKEASSSPKSGDEQSSSGTLPRAGGVCQSEAGRRNPATPSKPRATYKQQQEYKLLTEEIDALTKERQQLESLLASGVETDMAKISAASNRIGEVISLLDEKELRWLELDEIVNPS